MGRATCDERIARQKRVYDLRRQNLSYRTIIAKLKEEGWEISLHQIQLDLKAETGESKQETFPFWCFEKGREKYPNCCLCHKIGLTPRADGKPSVLFDYQYDIFKAIADNQHLAVVKARQIGITYVNLLALLYYCIYGFVKTHLAIIIPGTRSELSQDHIVQLKSMIEAGGYQELVDEEKTKKDRIIFKDRTEIRSLPSNTTAVRGMAVKYVFLDEAAMFDDVRQKEIMNSIRPLVATTKGHIVMVSTPRGRRGMFYETITGDPTWHKLYLPYTVSLGKMLTEEWIQKERHSSMDFEQEYNCAFSTPENAVYTQQFIEMSKGDYELVEYAPNDWRLNEPLKRWIEDINNKISGRYIPLYTNCVGGVDVGVSKDYTAVIILALFEKEWKPLVCKFYQHIGWPAIIEDLDKLSKEFNVEQFAVDATAMGKEFADMVVGKNINVEPVIFSSLNKLEMVNHCKKLLQGKELSLPKAGCPELLLQFGEQQQTVEGGKVKFSHPETRKDDLLWAWHLACKLIGERSEQAMLILSN